MISILSCNNKPLIELETYLEANYFDPYVTPMYHRLLREGGYVDAA